MKKLAPIFRAKARGPFFSSLPWPRSLSARQSTGHFISSSKFFWTLAIAHELDRRSPIGYEDENGFHVAG